MLKPEARVKFVDNDEISVCISALSCVSEEMPYLIIAPKIVPEMKREYFF